MCREGDASSATGQDGHSIQPAGVPGAAQHSDSLPFRLTVSRQRVTVSSSLSFVNRFKSLRPIMVRSESVHVDLPAMQSN